MNVVNLTETADRAAWARAVKAAAVIYCGVLPAIVIGMTIVESISWAPVAAGESVRYGLISGAVFVAPAALYAFLIRTNVVVVAGGAGLAALQTWSIWAATTGTASTAGLAILWIPFLGIPVMLLAWAVDVWIRAMWPVDPQS
ncbi:MAG: hypothetical protein M3134_01840 [Actinomycetota bacterium]|nr:hypothetical protein [Actinomycetota bacterium]